MKVILISPFYPYSKKEYTYNQIWPPLCLANCAALLEKEGHSVKILDAHAQCIAPNKITSFIKSYDKIFIASSYLDRWQCPNIDITIFFEMVCYIKEFTDEVYIMGYHGRIEPERMLVSTKTKAVIRGKPEYTTLELSRNNDLSGIQGISFRDNGKYISNLGRKLFNLKTLPTPAYHLLDIQKGSYRYIHSIIPWIILVVTRKIILDVLMKISLSCPLKR